MPHPRTERLRTLLRQGYTRFTLRPRTGAVRAETIKLRAELERIQSTLQGASGIRFEMIGAQLVKIDQLADHVLLGVRVEQVRAQILDADAQPVNDVLEVGGATLGFPVELGIGALMDATAALTGGAIGTGAAYLARGGPSEPQSLEHLALSVGPLLIDTSLRDLAG